MRPPTPSSVRPSEEREEQKPDYATAGFLSVMLPERRGNRLPDYGSGKATRRHARFFGPRRKRLSGGSVSSNGISD